MLKSQLDQKINSKKGEGEGSNGQAARSRRKTERSGRRRKSLRSEKQLLYKELFSIQG